MEEVSEVMREHVILEQLSLNTTHFLCITVSFNKGLANFSNLKTTDQKLGKKVTQQLLPTFLFNTVYLLIFQQVSPEMASNASKSHL